MAGDSRLTLPPLTDDLVLLDSGLDSLGIAVLVARLEDVLGLDPFTEFTSDEAAYPVTLGAFVDVYERAAQAHGFHSARAD
jgi:acyl carrier protein